MQHIAQPQPVLDRLPARRPKAACTLGIIGGGQLAKMIAQSALQLGCDIVVLERKEHSPAANLATETVIGDWDNPESLLVLGSMVDVVTLENEFVDADSLMALERFGHPLDAELLAMVCHGRDRTIGACPARQSRSSSTSPTSRRSSSPPACPDGRSSARARCSM